VGRCNGACVGKESARVHLARVRLGLMAQRLKPWPHEHPMLLREGTGERTEYHVIDGWQYLGTFDGEALGAQAGRDWQRELARSEFDIETYRIITRVLRERRLLPLPSPPRLRVDDSWN